LSVVHEVQVGLCKADADQVTFGGQIMAGG
jgi:hypothetical protein